jgi:phage terminase small subunit
MPKKDNGVKRIKDPTRKSRGFGFRPTPRGNGPIPDQFLDTRPNGRPDRNGGLTKIEQLFISEYLRDFDQFNAALRAGYKNGSQAYEVMKRPRVQDAIQNAFNARLEANRITSERVLKEVALLAFSDLTEFFEDFGKGRSLQIRPKEALSEEQRRMMSSISESVSGSTRTLKFKVHDKMRALHLLCDNLGLLGGAGSAEDPNDVVRSIRQAARASASTLPNSTNGD